MATTDTSTIALQSPINNSRKRLVPKGDGFSTPIALSFFEPMRIERIPKGKSAQQSKEQGAAPTAALTLTQADA